MSDVATWLAFGKEALAKHTNPVLEAQLLLAYVLHCDRVALYTWPEKEVSADLAEQFQALVQRRQQHEPMAYLIGQKEFWSQPFHVTQDTLIPRPETERLVEIVLAQLPEAHQAIADIGTGSGVIACALALSRRQWRITATDISAKALAIAKQNAQNLNISNITFIQSDWLAALGELRFDAIVSNPPYIREYDLHLTQGDLPFEPRIALTPGPSGLEAYQALIAQSRSHLKENGLIAFEHGYDQASQVQAILQQAGFKAIQTFQDFAGCERVTLGRL